MGVLMGVLIGVLIGVLMGVEYVLTLCDGGKNGCMERGTSLLQRNSSGGDRAVDQRYTLSGLRDGEPLVRYPWN